jgi:hypothetical protein
MKTLDPSNSSNLRQTPEKNSFFSKAIVDWNHLEDSVVCLIRFVSLIMFTKIQIAHFQWRDKMKNCMYINRKRVTD